MVNYNCECCGFETQIKTHYERHLKTKKHHSLSSCYPKITQKLPSSYPKVTPTSELCCKYCNAKFKYRSGLSRHIKFTCKKNEDEDFKELVKLMNEQIENMKNDMEMQVKKYDKMQKKQKWMENEIRKRDKKITKLSNKLQINNNCVVNQNTIQLLNYNETDTSHLTALDYVSSLKRQNNCVKSITEKIHYNPEKPENMNIYISNLKHKYVMVYDNNQWILKDCFDDIYEHKEILLEDWINREQDKYPELRDKFEKYLENKENDSILNNIKDDIKLFMYNNRKNVIENDKNHMLEQEILENEEILQESSSK